MRLLNEQNTLMNTAEAILTQESELEFFLPHVIIKSINQVLFAESSLLVGM